MSISTYIETFVSDSAVYNLFFFFELIVVTRHDTDLPAGWVEVSWNNSSSNSIRSGSDNKYDLKVVDMRNSGPKTSVSTNQQEIPLSAPAQDEPNQEPNPVPEQQSSGEHESSSEQIHEGSCDSVGEGSVEPGNIKSGSTVNVLVREGTGVPLARILGESPGTLETVSIIENALANQPGEVVACVDSSSEDTPFEQDREESVIMLGSDGSAEGSSIEKQADQLREDTTVSQQSSEISETLQAEKEGNVVSQNLPEGSTESHQSKEKSVSRTHTERAATSTETSVLVVNVGSSGRYVR